MLKIRDSLSDRLEVPFCAMFLEQKAEGSIHTIDGDGW